MLEAFRDLCHHVGREGAIGFSPLAKRELLPGQEAYLARRLGLLIHVPEATAVSLGLIFREEEVRAIPDQWLSRAPDDGCWNVCARAYAELHSLLDQIVTELAGRFGGAAESATIEGWGAHVSHVRGYFPACVSHRAFAEAAGVGWRGKNGLLVTPEAGPAVCCATLFLPYAVPAKADRPSGCGDCEAYVELCPILSKGTDGDSGAS